MGGGKYQFNRDKISVSLWVSHEFFQISNGGEIVS